jgi:hypothetical protein
VFSSDTAKEINVDGALTIEHAYSPSKWLVSRDRFHAFVKTTRNRNPRPKH